MEENYYKEKYIKYKTKYLELKNANSIGGIGNAGVLAASSRMQQPKMKRDGKERGRSNIKKQEEWKKFNTLSEEEKIEIDEKEREIINVKEE